MRRHRWDSLASAGGQENPANPAQNQDSVALDANEQALRFRRVHARHGVEMPDPGPDQQGMNEAWQAVAGDYERATPEQAIAACQDLIPQCPGQEEHGSDDPLRRDRPDELAAAMEECRNAI